MMNLTATAGNKISTASDSAVAWTNLGPWSTNGRRFGRRILGHLSASKSNSGHLRGLNLRASKSNSGHGPWTKMLDQMVQELKVLDIIEELAGKKFFDHVVQDFGPFWSS